MKQYYECHVTISSGWCDKERIDYDRVTAQLCTEINGWTWSEITGDPDLGPGKKWYATKHFNVRKKIENVIAAVDSLASALARSTPGMGRILVLRRKVELVVHDVRTPDGWSGA